ncbi:DUF445 domain-containing protein [Janthinobacterium fluminis]|uniref:DUF445 domain-containing protein n=1 Tax=Janthinobacterium fluminis TaxID=2987524 RepID=A0ABT5JVC9_9BURK|nr:DUF445 domain-containing protein [Janthinobacterium fluminis]MDC8756524.1 DUF445 domain-containing protein [Janthinobacterium fluminis]
MRERDQLAQLKRMRRIATGLLALMAALFLAARLLQAGRPYLVYLAAFAEAAMVGALADWFAVTALFRHPLGLPIPHTAIIARNKDRIGDNIASFLEHNFITGELVREELAQVDFAGVAARWLGQGGNAGAVAAQVAGAVPALLRLVEDEDAARFMRTALASALKDVKFAPLLAQVLSVLVAGRQHHVLLERILGIAARALEQNRPYIRQKVHENSPRWLPKAIDEKLFERLMEGVQAILSEIQGEDSEWRERFQDATEELIAKLATSAEYEEKLQALIGSGLGHPLLRRYAGQIWQDVRQRLLADAAAPDSRLAAGAEQAVRVFGKALAGDAAVRRKLNAWLRAVLADTIVERRDVIVSVVRRAIRKWDADTAARKIELHVGKDLQYIRINGTLVGGLVGLLLHALAQAL